MDQNLPIEVAFEKVKNELLYNANAIARKYELPSSLLALLLNELSQDLQLSAYKAIVANYDISVPEHLSRKSKEAKNVAPESEQSKNA